jgi:hypothetical protein
MWDGVRILADGRFKFVPGHVYSSICMSFVTVMLLNSDCVNKQEPTVRGSVMLLEWAG